MTEKRLPTACLLAFVVLVVAGCTGDPPADTSTAPAETAPTPADVAPTDVTYEPAYPDDVDAEGLSEQDVEQQAPHAHADGEPHVHGEDTHTHEPAEEPDDGQHDHPPAR